MNFTDYSSFMLYVQSDANRPNLTIIKSASLDWTMYRLYIEQKFKEVKIKLNPKNRTQNIR